MSIQCNETLTITTLELPQTYIYYRKEISVSKGVGVPIIKLKKKESGDTAESKLPEEIPELAKDKQPDAELKKEITDFSLDDVPAELPSLDLPDMPTEQQSPSEPEQQVPVEKKPIQHIETPKPEDTASGQQGYAVLSAPTKQADLGNAKEVMQESDRGFFSDVLNKLVEKNYQGSLLTGMKDYWKTNQPAQNIEEEVKTSKQYQLEVELNEKLRELRDMEEKWLTNTRDLKHQENIVRKIEAEIAIASEELQSILDKLEKVKAMYKKIQH
jgi:hypothetical protein